MRFMTDDLRIKEIKELIPPANLIHELSCSESASRAVHEARLALHRASRPYICANEASFW